LSRSDALVLLTRRGRRLGETATSPGRDALSEALERRCLYLHLDYPDIERDRAIVLTQVPEPDEALAGQLVAVVARLRDLELKKAPSLAECHDWARTLIAMETATLDEERVRQTLVVVLKHASDQQRAIRELKLARSRDGRGCVTSPARSRTSHAAPRLPVVAARMSSSAWA